MKGAMKNAFVISLGGSVFVPQLTVDIGYLRRFRLFLKKQIKKGHKFVLVVGGGGVCREYQTAAAKIAKASQSDRDWVGIYSTWLNAQLLRVIFSKEAEPIIFDQRFKFKRFGKKLLIVAGGGRPGSSTDFAAAQIAVDMGIKRVINLTNLPFVYTSDPRPVKSLGKSHLLPRTEPIGGSALGLSKFIKSCRASNGAGKDKTAKPIKAMDWKEYFKFICPKWSPGMHSPFDPVASKLAQKNGLEVIVASGKDLANLAKIINGQSFRGTIISDELTD